MGRPGRADGPPRARRGAARRGPGGGRAGKVWGSRAARRGSGGVFLGEQSWSRGPGRRGAEVRFRRARGLAAARRGAARAAGPRPRQEGAPGPAWPGPLPPPPPARSGNVSAGLPGAPSLAALPWSSRPSPSLPAPLVKPNFTRLCDLSSRRLTELGLSPGGRLPTPASFF